MKKYACLAIILTLLIITGSGAYACSVFNASDADGILVGNNEDGHNTDARVWFLPAENGLHGTVLFGFDDAWIQGGMNDQGLFLDWATEEPREVNFPRTAAEYKGNYNIFYQGNLNEKILRSCSSVEEAVGMYEKYAEIAFRNAHVMIADKSGASVIVEPYDGKLEVLGKENNYQFMTNFNISSDRNNSQNDARYARLDAMFKNNAEPTVDNFMALLSGVSANITVYSNIYNLKTGDIYLYYLHDFSNPIKFNLRTELDKGKNIYSLKELFEENAPDFGSPYDVNNKSLFSGKELLINIFKAFYLGVFLIWPALCLAKYVRGKKRSGKEYRFGQSPFVTWAFAVSSAAGLICFVFLDGVSGYGFFIRYRFTFYQEILFVLPYAIVGLTAAQLFFAAFSRGIKTRPVWERILYLLVTVCFIASSINLQSWCWRIF